MGMSAGRTTATPVKSWGYLLESRKQTGLGMTPMTAHPPITVGALLLIAALTAPAVAQARPSSEHSYPMPKMVSWPYQALPIWAEASVAVSPDGELNPVVWGSETGRIHQIRTTPADNAIYFNDQIVGYRDKQSAPGCRDVRTTYFAYPDPPPLGPLDDAHTTS